jgi:hypothetical protein
MGDRCYMSITCRAQDKHLFEPLGFVEETIWDNTTQQEKPPKDTGTIEMVDTEANYAHNGDLPTTVPWYGHHYEGGEYPASKLACDGEILLEHAWDGHGNYSIPFNEETGEPHQESIDQVKEFILFRNQVIASLHQHEQPALQPA